jgi:hypothetical protein
MCERSIFVVTKNAGDSRSRDNYNRGTGVKREYKNNNAERRDFKSSQTTAKGGDYKKKDYNKKSYGNPYDKDKDGDYKNSRDNRSKAAPGKDSKSKEQQIGKIDIINRLEKEKKAVQKKKNNDNNRKSNKNVKPQIKPKRINNIDWTKEYENDSYDDDDLDIYL